MRLQFYLLLPLMMCISLASFAQTKLTGRLTDQKGNPLKFWAVKNLQTGEKTHTDENGKFIIHANQDESLAFSSGKFMVPDFQVTNVEIASKILDYTTNIVQSPNAGAALTTDSYWLGATLGYNLGGNSSEDVVGSAKVMINPMSDKLFGAQWGVIGNFSNFQTAQDKGNTDKNIKSVIQSSQGLFLGLSSLWTLNKDADVKTRIQYTMGGKLNGFTHVGPDSSTQTLIQYKNSLGFELEGFQFSKGGMLNLSFEGSLLLFDKGIYQKVFNSSKSSLLTFEASVVLPISTNTGILFNSTFAQSSQPVFLVGVIFKTNNN